MTVLYGSAQAVISIKAEALANHKAKAPKYHLRAGREYLHWSAGHLTTDSKQAWSGTVEQARACRRTFSAAAGCKAVEIPPIQPYAGDE